MHERRQLLREAAPLRDTESDSLVVYPIGSQQERGVLSLGKSRPEVEVPSYFIV